jgi:hypothetical protein
LARVKPVPDYPDLYNELDTFTVSDMAALFFWLGDIHSFQPYNTCHHCVLTLPSVANVRDKGELRESRLGETEGKNTEGESGLTLSET